MKNDYKTILDIAEGSYKEKGSKFFAFAFPIANEADIKKYQEELRKKYYDARHHCYAYVLGQHYEHYRANDDGEPNHSAGDPILGQIKSKDLTKFYYFFLFYKIILQTCVLKQPLGKKTYQVNSPLPFEGICHLVVTVSFHLNNDVPNNPPE